MRVIYEGFFVIDNLDHELQKDIENKHVTTEFRPANSHEHLYGTEATFIVTGYGNDSVNEGYSVKLAHCDNDELIELYNNIAIPHITLSVSLEGKPVNTANLEFNEHKYDGTTIRCKFGGFIGKPIFSVDN